MYSFLSDSKYDELEITERVEEIVNMTYRLEDIAEELGSINSLYSQCRSEMNLVGKRLSEELVKKESAKREVDSLNTFVSTTLVCLKIKEYLYGERYVDNGEEEALEIARNTLANLTQSSEDVRREYAELSTTSTSLSFKTSELNKEKVMLNECIKKLKDMYELHDVVELGDGTTTIIVAHIMIKDGGEVYTAMKQFTKIKKNVVNSSSTQSTYDWYRVRDDGNDSPVAPGLQQQLDNLLPN